MKYCKEVRKFKALDTIYELCVKYNFYNVGTVLEFERMLEKCKERERATTELLFDVAKDIVNHTSTDALKKYWCGNEDDYTEQIIELLFEKCTSTTFILTNCDLL